MCNFKTLALVFLLTIQLGGHASAQALSRSDQVPSGKAALPDNSFVTQWITHNGIEVVHIRKPSSKVLVSVVTVDVGSKDEGASTNGLSHLLEHMVFDGTSRRSRAEINEGSKQYGGYVNATTQAGFTSYLSIFPSEFAQLSLDLQADMLFNSTIPPDELEKERKVVIEEMKRDRDAPSTRADELHDGLLFAGTPYAQPVLGFEKTISAVSRATVLNYYHRNYVPSRMKVMITSPFPPEKIRPWIEGSFGTARATPAAPEATPQWKFPIGKPPVFKEDKVPSAYLRISLPAPALGDPDIYAFDLLAHYLVEEAASPLQRALREGRSPLVDNLSANLEMEKGFCVWKLALISQPQQIPAVVDTLQRTLQSVAAAGIPPETLTRLQLQIRSEEAILSEQAMYYGLMKAPLLNAKGFSFMSAYPAHLHEVTPEDLRRVAKKYFSTPQLFITALVPTGKVPAFNATPEDHGWKKETLSNGFTLIAKGSDESDVFALSVLTRQRSAIEPPGREGISDFVQRMLLKGTTTKTAEDIQKNLDQMAAQIQYVDNPFIPYDDAWTTNRFNFFRLEVLDELREKALVLMGDILVNANFPEDQVAKVRDEILRLQQREADNSSKRALQRLHELLLAGTPYTHTILGNSDSIKWTSGQNLLEHFKRQYAPSNVVIVAAGRGTTAGLMGELKSHFEAMGGKPVEVESSIPGAISAFKLEKIPANKQQTQIAVGTLVGGWNSPDSPGLRILNAILSERLAVQLREKQGLAYSVGSDLQQEETYGWMEVRMGSRAETSEEARQGILNVIHALASSPITDEERERAVNGLWGSLLRQRLSRIGQTFYRGVDEVRGPGFDAEERWLPALQVVTWEQLNRLAHEVSNTDHWVMVSVGSK